MVHKENLRGRGRPRSYDPTTALAGARDAFWQHGYSGASLERLSDATDMNRPSMYAAFGDKHALYLKTLEIYVARASSVIAATLAPQVSLADALTGLYENALKWYLPTGKPARGCYLIGTAATEAATDAEIRTALLEGLRSFDRAIRSRIEQAKGEGELPSTADVDSLSIVASAVLHTLAVRSRAGESKPALKAIIAKSVGLICGKPARRSGKSAVVTT